MPMMSECLPSLRTYAEALAYWEQVVPYKGGADKAGERPLGRVRRYTRSLIHSDPVAESVTCSLYGNALVTFYKTGALIVSSRGYPTMMTKGFLFDILGYERVASLGARIYYRDNEGFLHLLNDDVVIDPTGKVVSERYVEYRYNLVKSAMKARRAQYKPFLDYAKQVLSVAPKFELSVDNRVAYLSLSNHRGVDERQEFFKSLENALTISDEENRLTKLYLLLRQVAVSFGDTEGIGSVMAICGFAKFSKTFDELLKYEYEKELFEQQEVPLGKKIITDRNFKYVR